MRHRLQWFVDLRAHGLRKEDEHPAYSLRGMAHLTFLLSLVHITRTELNWPQLT